jgi:hypothetical protein
MPPEDTERGKTIEKELRILFDKHAADDKIEVFYDTNIFYCKL